MTISLEEHVARAVLDEFWKCAQEQDWSGAASSAGRLRRAAIAAVREREGAASPCQKCGQVFAKCGCWSCSPSPDPAEAMRAKCEAEMRGMADDCDRLRMWARKDAFLHGADVIAALKGNGEGR